MHKCGQNTGVLNTEFCSNMTFSFFQCWFLLVLQQVSIWWLQVWPFTLHHCCCLDKQRGILAVVRLFKMEGICKRILYTWFSKNFLLSCWDCYFWGKNSSPSLDKDHLMNFRRKYYICIYYCSTIKEMTCNACKGGQIVFPHSMQTRNFLFLFVSWFRTRSSRCSSQFCHGCGCGLCCAGNFAGNCSHYVL